MRTPIEVAVTKPVPVECKPRVLAQEPVSTSRPFSHMLAEAESVQDVVYLSGRLPPTASGVTAWKDAWNGLCRGANVLMSGELRLDGIGRNRQRRARR